MAAKRLASICSHQTGFTSYEGKSPVSPHQGTHSERPFWKRAYPYVVTAFIIAGIWAFGSVHTPQASATPKQHSTTSSTLDAKRPTKTQPATLSPSSSPTLKSENVGGYAGTWFSPDSGFTMVMTTSGQATFSTNGAEFIVQFNTDGNNLVGKITRTPQPSAAYVVGTQLGLSMASDGGLNFDTHVSDGGEFYRAEALSYYAGTWKAQATSMTISPSGTGTMTYSGPFSCPLPTTTDSSTCDVTINFTFEVTIQGAVATITSSTVTMNDGRGSIPEATKVLNGKQFYLTVTDTNDVIIFNITPLLYSPVNYPLINLCKKDSAPYEANTCGAV
jgi:hypothetical protein